MNMGVNGLWWVPRTSTPSALILLLKRWVRFPLTPELLSNNLLL